MSLNLQQFGRGWFTIDAVQLTEDNINDVFEWADSKPFFEPIPTEPGKLQLTGLTVFEPTGRRKANFGDWIYRTPGGSFQTRPDAEFQGLFAEVAQ